MSEETADESVPLPEYEVTQYFPRNRSFTDEERRELRAEYGYVRAYFKMRPESFRDLQTWLNQARFGVTYDVYLTRSVTYALAVSGVGLLLGVLLALALESAGVLAGLTSPVRVPAESGFAGVAQFVVANKALFAGALVAVLSTAVFGGATWAVRYYWPRTVVATRRQAINFILPHAIVFMYALSYGGMNLVEVIRRVAEADDAYGDVALEFDMVTRDLDLFGNDLYTALRNARNITPSENMEDFLDDLISVLDSGGDVTAFFEEQGRRYLERAREDQEDFLETLAVLSEVFIAAFVATPLFLIVILLVISLLGGSGLGQMAILTYALLPVGMVAFLALLSVLSQPYVTPDVDLDVGLETPAHDEGALAGDEAYEAYRRAQRWRRLEELLSDPFRGVREQPYYTLLVSVPLTLLYLGGLSVLGELPLSVPAFLEAPVLNTVWVVVVPFFLLTVPLAFFHELRRGRNDALARQFPDTLNVLSSANNMGVAFTDALGIVARWSGGYLGEELSKTRNDIEWNSNTATALLSFGNRIDVPQLRRTVKLIAEGSRSTGDLSRILSIAAEDTRNRYRILRNRRRAMASYIAVVVIGFLVYLMVIILLDTSYLQPIAELSEGAEASNPGAPGLPIGFSDVPIDTYRMLFFHSVFMQAVGSGLIAGKLADNDLLSGLKYSILLVALALGAFVLI